MSNSKAQQQQQPTRRPVAPMNQSAGSVPLNLFRDIPAAARAALIEPASRLEEKLLVQLVSDEVYQIIYTVYDEAVKAIRSVNGPSENIVSEFQLRLQQVPNWSVQEWQSRLAVFQYEQKELIYRHVESLLVHHMLLLTTFREPTSKLHIPRVDYVLMQLVTTSAERFYTVPFLFTALQTDSTLFVTYYQQSMQIIEDSVHKTILKLLPIREIMTETKLLPAQRWLFEPPRPQPIALPAQHLQQPIRMGVTQQQQQQQKQQNHPPAVYKQEQKQQTPPPALYKQEQQQKQKTTTVEDWTPSVDDPNVEVIDRRVSKQKQQQQQQVFNSTKPTELHLTSMSQADNPEEDDVESITVISQPSAIEKENEDEESDFSSSHEDVSIVDEEEEDDSVQSIPISDGERQALRREQTSATRFMRQPVSTIERRSEPAQLKPNHQQEKQNNGIATATGTDRLKAMLGGGNTISNTTRKPASPATSDSQRQPSTDKKADPTATVLVETRSPNQG